MEQSNTLYEIDRFCKQALLPYLEAADCYEGRQDQIKSLCVYQLYDYPEKVLKIYREFIHLDVFSYFYEDKKPKWEYYIEFKDGTDVYSDNDDELRGTIWQDVLYSQLLGKDIFFIGEDRDSTRVCIDENHNFYTVSEWGITLWGKSFYQGMYNMLMRKDGSEGNPYFMRYTIDWTYNFEDYPRNAKGKVLWRDALKPENAQRPETYFTVDL